MKSLFFVYTLPGDEGVAIISGAPGKTESEILNASVPHNALKVRSILPENLPQDRYFRDAWTDQNPGSQIDVDLIKAQAIQMNNIRSLRDQKLKALDVEQLKVLADPIKVAEIDAQKQVLRDIPQTFDLTIAVTPEELKVLLPEEVL